MAMYRLQKEVVTKYIDGDIGDKGGDKVDGDIGGDKIDPGKIQTLL